MIFIQCLDFERFAIDIKGCEDYEKKELSHEWIAR